MDEIEFDRVARDELRRIEEALADVDPDDVELSGSDGVLKLDLRDGTKVVINAHRAARQIWMAAVATAWHFDRGTDGAWRAARSGEELSDTLDKILRERAGVAFTRARVGSP